jgi:hypothetical protein
MASGVDLLKYPEHIQDALVSVQLDNDLAEYYKLMASMHIVTQNAEKANECAAKYAEITLPEISVKTNNKEEMINKELAAMDNWLLKIDKDSLPKHVSGLILRKDPVDLKAKRRKTVRNPQGE